jgi:hypothetical protein
MHKPQIGISPVWWEGMHSLTIEHLIPADLALDVGNACNMHLVMSGYHDMPSLL